MDRPSLSPLRYLVGITGASGSIYGYRLAQELLMAGCELHLIVTDIGRQVMTYELERPFDDLIADLQSLKRLNTANGEPQECRDLLYLEDPHDFFAVIASGSYPLCGIVIAPCSMGTLGKIAAGTGDNLLIRAADVALKERHPLILLAREAPLNAIHLQNMLTLNQAGAVIFPPVPAFYHKPVTINDLIDQTVGRVLSILGVKSTLTIEWKAE